MELRVLGPLELVSGGSVVPVAARKHRELLLLLLLEPGRPVDAVVLVDELWDGAAPRSAASVLRTYVGQLRRLLPADAVLESAGGRYRLRVGEEQLDVLRFAALVERGSAAVATDPERAVGTLREGLALWRGRPYDEVADRPCALPEVARLEDLRWRALEAEGEAQLALGRHRELVPELERRVAQAPLREALQAQLVLALYRGGRQGEALAAYDALRRLLDEELGLEPSEPLQRLQEQVLRHDPALVGPPALPREPPVVAAAPPLPRDHPPAAPRHDPPAAPRRGLPFPVTAFVGREGDVDDLVDLLRTRRLVTLTGPGGAGKSRLALEVGHRYDDAARDGDRGPVPFADGVRLAELAALDGGHGSAGSSGGGSAGGSVSDVVGVVGAALGLPLGPASAVPVGGSPLDPLTEQAAGLDVLLVLDNCEHVVAAAATVVAGLLARGPAVRVLATSRLPLGLAGEVLWQVPPLAVPPPTVATLEELVAFDAGALLADRARLVRPRAALAAEEVAEAAAICRRLDGLPLALELAAARLRTLTVPGVAAALDHRLDLANRDPTAPRRQRSLRDLLDWSVGLLTPDQRRLLARVAVFPAPPTAEDVADVAGPDLPGADVPALLADLVEHSLLTLVVGRGEARYGLLEVVREHALGLLEPGEADRLRASVARRYGGSAARPPGLCGAAVRSSPSDHGAAGAPAPGGHDGHDPHTRRARPAHPGPRDRPGGGRGRGPRRPDADRR